MKFKDPDELLAGTNRSTMLNATAVSLAIHLALIFGTSFGLYAQWGEYGFHSPSRIKEIKKEREDEAAEEARRKAVRERAAAQEAAKEQSAAAPQGERAQPPAEPELEALPPKAGFTLGEDFSF